MAVTCLPGRAQMARTTHALKIPSASRQVFFHQLLVAARKQWLSDALSDAVSRINPNQLKRELAAYIPEDMQRILAAAAIRDEQVFPVPIVLETKPTLIGYYRLLLGVPQKWFYAGGTGMGQFKSMEMRGRLTETQKARLPEFCEAMTAALSELVRQMSPTVTMLDVKELPLLTIGSQFQGSNNTRIGKQAIEDAFLAVVEIVKGNILDQTDRKLIVRNAAGRKVIIGLGSDPDIGIAEEFANQLRKKVAVEVKGGTDRSNAHNRAGEAEKSHQKAKKAGFRDFWTIISKRGLDMKKIEAESPTTNSWFDVSEVLGRQGEDWQEFKSRLAGEVGIPLK